MNTERLKSRLRGSVVAALGPTFGDDADALVWNGRKPQRRTRLIVRAASATDVQGAVRFAAEHGLSVSPRGGGHHFTGIASQADMVIDLGALDGLRLDPEARTARVEPAVTNLRMATALDRHGLAFPLGHCGSVPMSGYLLGGGIGWNEAEWGFACFLVTSVEVVLADGRLVTASDTENTDIFWAVRGAGPGFFGIVTAYHVQLKPTARALTTVIRVYPAGAVAEVSAWAETVMASAPANVEFTAKVAAGPAGPVVAAIATVYAQSDAEAQRVLDDLASGAPQALEVIGPLVMPLPALYGVSDASVPEGRRYRVDSFWSDAALGAVLTRTLHEMTLAPSAETFAVISLRPNAAKIPADAALSCEGRVFGTVYAIWSEQDQDERNTAWLHGMIEAITPLCSATYVGLADLDRPGRRLPTHSEDARRRLDSLRVRFDPNGLFAGRSSPPALAAE